VSFSNHLLLSCVSNGRVFKGIIAPESSYAIALMLTISDAVMPSYASSMKTIKSDTEIDGMREGYLRDGASFVKFLHTKSPNTRLPSA